MRRSFGETLLDLPEVEVPCWALLERVAEFFSRHLPSDGMFSLTGEDGRGSYRARKFGDFRRLVEEQLEQPHTIRLFAEGTESKGLHRQMLVITSRQNPDHAQFVASIESSDEMLVDHFKRRIDDLFAAAAAGRLSSKTPAVAAPVAGQKRVETFEEASIRAAHEYAIDELESSAPRYVNVVTDIRPAPTRRERRRARLHAFFYNPWVVTVGGALIASVIALIVALAH